ncbi:MAG: hypothetical protein HDR89_07700 [Bacteroides sp.]|nr:hypothetical protein [Bacteroides sp.]
MTKRHFITTVISLFISVAVLAADSDYIALGAYVSNDSATIPTEAASLLCGRMQRAIAANGFADNQPTGRFALVAKCNVLEKDIAATTPPRISQKLELSFVVVDLIENKIYDGCDMTVSGIGTNETKAFSSAFQKVSAQNQSIKALLANAKEKILDYYTSSCTLIQTEAKTFASTGQFDKAIFILISVPPVCMECYDSCQQLAALIYQQKIDTECNLLLEQAKGKWASSPSETTALEIAGIIGQIDPRASRFDAVIEFRNSVSAKLADDVQRQWKFQMKKYEDNQQFKRSIVDACRSVGEIFAKNFQLPQINLFKYY